MENINNSENNNSKNDYDETPISEILRLMNEHDRQERDEQAVIEPRIIRVPTVINEEDIQESIVIQDCSGDIIREPLGEPFGEPMESNFIEDELDSKEVSLPSNKIDEIRPPLESVSLNSSVDAVCSIQDVIEIIENNVPLSSALPSKPKCKCVLM
jgi:hypothetical protein